MDDRYCLEFVRLRFGQHNTCYSAARLDWTEEAFKATKPEQQRLEVPNVNVALEFSVHDQAYRAP